MPEKTSVLRRGEPFGQWPPQGVGRGDRERRRATTMEFADENMERISVLRAMIPNCQSNKVFNHSFAQLEAYDREIGFFNVIAIYSPFVGDVAQLIATKTQDNFEEKEILTFTIPQTAWESGIDDVQIKLSTLAKLPQASHIFRAKFDETDGRSKLFGVYFKSINVGFFSDITHCVSSCYENSMNIVLEKVAEVYNKNFIKVKAQKEKKEEKRFPKVNLKWGLDPEFELGFGGRICSASGAFMKTRLAGVDGSGSQIEFRPNPATDVAGILVEFRKAMKEFVDNNRNLKSRKPFLSALGNTYPLGCHIHCSGADAELLPILFDRFLTLPVWSEMGSARGYYKGTFEDASSSILRCGKEHGGWEYRALPSSVLFSPVMARVVFKIARNLAKRYYEGWPFEIPESGKKNHLYSYEMYKKYCGLSKREYGIFSNFCAGAYRDMYKNVLSNWKIAGFQTSPEDTKEKFSVRAEFGDDWSAEAKHYFDTLLEQYTGKVNENIMVRLFGLNRDRGKSVAGFTASGYETIEHETVNRNPLAFGFPRTMRAYGEDMELLGTAFINKLNEKIKENIIKK